MLTLVLCRFSVSLTSIFLKLHQKFVPIRSNNEWLSLPDKWKKVISARECRYCLDFGKTLTKSANSSWSP